MKSVLKQWWFWIVSISFLAYYPVINNFFGWDDFLWLYRAKTLSLNPSQIFKVDTFYFDPLVHLSFWLNFKLSGLDYRWYHLTDITLHSINGLLLFRFMKLYSRDETLALLSSLIFVSTFAASDAVLWSSSRVDLLATLFSLVTLISFLSYLKEDKASLYTTSLITYILALAAKGTPVVIPVLLLWFFVKERKETKKRYRIFIPFAVIALGYFILLRLAAGGSSPVFKGAFHLSLHNYSLAVASLFIPEIVLSRLNLAYAFSIIYGLLFIFWLIRFPLQLNKIKSTGLFMMFLFITPVLILRDFTLPSVGKPIHYLLMSPSHRIYFASIGMSVFMGSVLVWIYEIMASRKKLLAKTFIGVIALLVLGFNVYETHSREKIWSLGVMDMKDGLYGMMDKRPGLNEGSIVGLINFPMSEGFLWPMLKVYYGLKEVTVIPMNSVPTKLPDALVSPDGNYALFAKGKKEVYDLSKPFNEMLLKAYRYQNSRDIAERESYSREYNVQAINLNQTILNIDSQ